MTFRVVGVALVALVAAGCAGDPDSVDVDGPYASDFAAAIAAASKPEVRSVLEDHRIEDAEYAEMRARAITCAQDAGVDVGISEGKYYDVGPLSDDPVRAEAQTLAWDTCYETWLTDVEWLYAATTTNPDNEDFGELVAACLVRKGLADEPFTKREFNEALERGDVDLQDPAAAACLETPLE